MSLEDDVAALVEAQRRQKKAWKAFRKAHRAFFDAELRTMHARFNFESAFREEEMRHE